MLRTLSVLAMLAFAPSASAAVPPPADGAPGMACYSQSGQLHCNELPPDWTCAELQRVIDSTNSTGTSDPITMVDCQDATRILFNGLRAVSPMQIDDRGPVRDDEAEAGGGDHAGVFLAYFHDERFHIYEAADGSDMGELLRLAGVAAGCGSAELPFSVVTLATPGPGRVTINGQTIDVEQADVRVERAERTDLYGRILIKGEPIEFE